MKIMMVTPYFPPKIGGLENYAYNVAKELKDKYGHDVFIVTSNHMTNQQYEDTYKGIRVIRLPVAFKLSNTPLHPLWFFMMRRIIKHEKPSLINAHSPVPYIADMALLAAGKTPTLLTYHSGSMKKNAGLVDVVLSAYENVLLPLMLRRASAIATVYPEFIQTKLRSSEHSKVFYAPPCVDVTIFKPTVPRNKTAKRLVFVGKVAHKYEWKGLRVLLEAVALLKDVPSLTLTIVGDGDAIDLYKQLATSLAITKQVNFTGPLRDAKLAAVYQAATVLCLPSTTDAEAFGTVMIEAMACGTPVVASAIGGMPNVIKSTGGGLLVRPGDPIELAATLRTLLNDVKQIQQLSAKGLHAVQTNYTWEKTAATYEAHITEIALKQLPTIVQVTPYYPPHLGGMENVTQEIAIQLAREGHRVEVITSAIGYRSDYQDAAALKGNIQRLRSTEVAHLPLMWGLIPALIRTPPRSIFHVHVAQAFIPEVALCIARLKRNSFIAHFHLDVSGSGGSASFIFTLYKKTLFPFMLRHADRVIVFSEAQQQLVHEKYGVSLARTRVIPNGVTVSSKAAPRQYKDGAKRLLYVGRLSPQKRVDRLIESMRYVDPAVHLDIVGNGECEAELKALVRRLKLKNITFHGALFGTRLRAMYKAAELFVLASDREGMPLVLLEAMAASLPVIATDSLGIRELIAGSGVLVQSTDPEDFAHAIKNNSSAARLNLLSKQSLAKAKLFSWNNITQQLEALYTEVLS